MSDPVSLTDLIAQTWAMSEDEIERQSANQDALEQAVRHAISEALQNAVERFGHDYALEYVAGILAEQSRTYPRNRDSRSPRKQVIRASLRRQVFERDAYRCRHCGGWDALQVDHVYPESKGGTLTLDNLQTLCRSCNSRKGVLIDAPD